MTLNEREKKIAIGTTATVVILGLYQFVFSPLMARRDTIASRHADLQQKLDEASDLFSRERRLQKVWSDLQVAGLNVDASTAEGQAQQAVIVWAEKAGITLSALKPERSTEEQKFQVIAFNVTGTGSMPDVARMLWAMETAAIPLRVNDVQITPRKEGTDDLSARFSVSALCLPPTASAGAAGTGGISR